MLAVKKVSEISRAPRYCEMTVAISRSGLRIGVERLARLDPPLDQFCGSAAVLDVLDVPTFGVITSITSNSLCLIVVGSVQIATTSNSSLTPQSDGNDDLLLALHGRDYDQSSYHLKGTGI